jgi:flagellar protein FlaF
VIVAYLLVGSVLSTSQIVTSAQKSATSLEEHQLKTDFTINQAGLDSTGLNCTITNTGNEPISDFSQMDIYVYDSSTGAYQLYRYDTSPGIPGTWSIISTGTDVVHPGELDPGETYRILVQTAGTSPAWFQITTANAVSASSYLT